MHYNRRPAGDRGELLSPSAWLSPLTVHRADPPLSQRTDRVCTYVTMAPAELLSPKDKATKQEIFRSYGATTHNPFENIFVREKEEGDLQDPVKHTPHILKLAGMVDYE